jgi:Family of unknown function (DUF5681)
MTWQKGQSGNPGGRRRKTDAEREAERIYADLSPRAAKQVCAIVDTGEWKGRALTPSEYATFVRLVADRTLVGTDDLLPLGTSREQLLMLRAQIDGELALLDEDAGSESQP